MKEPRKYPAAVFNKLSVVPPDLRRLVHERAAELARIAGRLPMSVCQEEYEQAKRELTGERDAERQQRLLDGNSGSPRAAPA